MGCYGARPFTNFSFIRDTSKCVCRAPFARSASSTALATRSEETLSTTFDQELPDHVIVALLRREALLTKAKLHALSYEHIMGERSLRTLKAQLRQVRGTARYAMHIIFSNFRSSIYIQPVPWGKYGSCT